MLQSGKSSCSRPTKHSSRVVLIDTPKHSQNQFSSPPLTLAEHTALLFRLHGTYQLHIGSRRSLSMELKNAACQP
jgi:hypothetical protein